MTTDNEPKLHLTNPADVLEPAPQKMRNSNGANWQLYPRIFARYNRELGPFTLDACADVHGRNAMLPTYWTAEHDCRKQDWAGHNAWAHPPGHVIQEALQQFLQCKQRMPQDTAGTFLLQYQPSAAWWAIMRSNFCLIDYHAGGSDLFVDTPTHEGGMARVAENTPYAMVVVHSAKSGSQCDSRACMDWNSLPPEQSRDLEPMFHKLNLGETLTDDQREKLKDLVREQPNIWALSMADLERANVAVHKIETGDAPPVATRMYRYSKLENDCINKSTSTLMENGLVRPSKSPYAAPPVPVMDGHKGDGAPKPRICFDYRALNAQTRSDMYPMPLVDEELAAVNVVLNHGPYEGILPDPNGY